MNVSGFEIAFLGTKHHPTPWTVPTPVVVLPNLQQRMAFTHFQHLQRFTFFFMVYCGMVLVVGILLEFVVRVFNLVFARKGKGGDYQLLDETDPTKDAKVLHTKLSMLQQRANFSVVDIWFTMYFALYHMFCAALVAVALKYGYMDSEFGMNFEMYIPWVIEALGVHVLSILACVWTRVRKSQEEETPPPLTKVIISLMPFLSERFNLLRDWVTIGIYLKDLEAIGIIAAALVFLSLALCVAILFHEPKLVLSMRLNYWPVAKAAMLSEDSSGGLRSKASEAHALLVARLADFNKIHDRQWRGKVAEFQLKVICEMDVATQQHKVVNTLYGEIPQAVASLLFVFFSRFSNFVVICLCIYVSKVFLLIFVRPYVLCLMADAGLGWAHLKASDVIGMMRSRKRFKTFCRWEKRVINGLVLISEMKEGPEEVAAAVIGISKLMCENDDDDSAKFVVMYTKFLRELWLELSEDNEGVRMVKAAITDAMKRLVPGIDDRDVAAHLPSSGNLGYMPTGSSLIEVEKIITEMHQGEHDVVKLLEARDAARYASVGRDWKKNDLMIFFTDCEADDIMAIAQLWQLKIEKINGHMAEEPVVIFCADFADKEHGTVFEKKVLLAQLVLGLHRFYILTPDAKLRKPSEHPLAQFYEDSRDSELDAIGKRIKEFKGNNLYLYIMTPGKGNLAATIQKLRSLNAWPSSQKWYVSIYSGSFNIRGMTKQDIGAINEFGSRSEKPLLDAAKFPFFGGKDPHPWTDCFTTFAPEAFPGELNMVAHPFVPACLKLLNDEHNLGLVAPGKLYKTKKLTLREQERFDSLKMYHRLETISNFAKAIQDDFALFSKVEGFKKSTLTAFAYDSCDSPLADQLIFLLEMLLEQDAGLDSAHSDQKYLAKADVVGAWVVSEKGFTSINTKRVPSPQCCAAIQPVLAEPLNETRLTDLRNKLQDYLLKHIRCLKAKEAGYSSVGST